MLHPIVGERLTIKIKSPNKLLFGRKFSFLASPISQIIILTLKLEKEYRLHEPQAPSKKVLEGTWLERYPQAWAETRGMREARSVSPIVVMLKTGVTPIGVQQYPMSKEAQEGIRPHIQRILELGVWSLVSLPRILCCYQLKIQALSPWQPYSIPLLKRLGLSHGPPIHQEAFKEI